MTTPLVDDVPVMLWTADRDRGHTWLNRRWYERTGRDPGSGEGVGWLDAVHPDDRAAAAEAVRGAKSGSDLVRVAYRLQLADGSYARVTDVISPRSGPDGEDLGLVGAISCANDRASDALMEARLAAIVESSQDAIISKTLEGTVLSWNGSAERIFGYTADEMVGASIYRLVPPDGVDEEQATLARVAAGERVSRYEAERIAKDGGRVYIDLMLSPIRDANGDIVAVSSIKRDVTLRKRSEERVRQSDKMAAIGRLAGGLAHDFNNQLHALQGFVDFVASEPALGLGARADLAQIRVAAERMASLTRQLLAFARQQVLAPEVLDLDVAVAELQPMLTRLVGSNVETDFRTTPGRRWVRFDRAQLAQVVMNLVINARDALVNGGRVIVTTRTRELDAEAIARLEASHLVPGAYAELAVIDTGRGIAPEHLAHIFEPFFTTKAIGEGTGLGLPTVHGIVTQSRGAVAVESKLGQGTTFSIYLPVVEAPTTAPAALLPQARPPATPGARVLVIDDEDLVRRVVVRTLQQAGYDVHEAKHGLEGLARLIGLAGHIDLILSDVVMPVLGGSELADRLARDFPGIPIIWMSGHPREVAFAANRMRVDQPYLQKPVDRPLLVEVVRSVLNGTTSTSS